MDEVFPNPVEMQSSGQKQNTAQVLQFLDKVKKESEIHCKTVTSAGLNESSVNGSLHQTSTSDVIAAISESMMKNTRVEVTHQILQATMNTSVLVLTTNTQKGTVEASMLLDPASAASASLANTYPWTSSQLCNLHSLAQANLISDTQDQISKQLSEENEKEAQHLSRIQSQTDQGDVCEEKKSKEPLKQIAIIEPRPNEPKTFVCSVKGCGRRFAWPAHFKYHQLTHANDRRFLCEVDGCNKRFLTAQRLQVHLRTHTGEKPYLCPHCGKSFTTAGNLKNHSRIHTGERPFGCEQCGRHFAEYSSLHKHSLVHSGAKPFTCEICGKGFSQSGSRRVHMDRHKTECVKHASSETGEVVEDEKLGLTVKLEPPGMVVLCNAPDDSVHYQDLQNAESVVFTQGLTDHIVTVTTQPADGEAESLEMTNDILGAEEVLGDDQMNADSCGVSSSVVVLSEPSNMVSLAHTYHHRTQHEQQIEDAGAYDHNQLLHPDLHQEEITTSDEHDLTYSSLDGHMQGRHDGQGVAGEIEVSVESSSSSHPNSAQNIHLDPMMESDEESDIADKNNS